MIGTSLLSLMLLALAGVLLDAHRREWAAHPESGAGPTPPDEAGRHRFARRRFRRRSLATGMIALVGALIAVWPIVPREPAPMACYTAALTMLAGAIFTLGVADAWASGRYYRGESRRQLAEHAERLREAVKDRPPKTAGEAEGSGG